MEKTGRKTKISYEAHVREIAEALGISVTPFQWVVIESDEGMLTGHVTVAVWESTDA